MSVEGHTRTIDHWTSFDESRLTSRGHPSSGPDFDWLVWLVNERTARRSAFGGGLHWRHWI